MEIRYILFVISWFVINTFGKPDKPVLRKALNNEPGYRKGTVSKNDRLLNVLQSNNIEYDAEDSSLDLTNFKVNDITVEDSEFTVEYDGSNNLAFGNLFEISKDFGEATCSIKTVQDASEENSEEESSGETRPKVFELNINDVSATLNDETLTLKSLQLQIGNNNYEINAELEAPNPDTLLINPILKSFGYEDKETYLNTEQIDSFFRSAFHGGIDTFDTFKQIFIRMGSDNNWHIAFIPNGNYMMFVCTHLGKNDIEEKNCAVVKRITNQATFLHWAKLYANELNFDLLNFNFEKLGSSLISSKSLMTYQDNKNAMYTDLLTKELPFSNKVSMEIDGGEDYYIVNIPYRERDNTDLGLDFGPQYRQLHLQGKLYEDKFEFNFEPKVVSMTTFGLGHMFAEGSKLQTFLTNPSNLFARRVSIETLVLKKHQEVCVTFSIFEQEIALGYAANRSKLIFCQKGQQLQFSTNGEEEILYKAKATLDAEYDGDENVMKYSGEIFITESKQIFEETSDFVPSGYESLQHIKNFPITKLYHYHTVSRFFVRFDGDAIFNNKEFNIQVIHWLFTGIPDSTAMCLMFDYPTSGNEGTSANQRQDTEEPDSSGDGTNDDQQPHIRKPLSLANLTSFLLQRKNVEFNDVANFASLRISFQPGRTDFYTMFGGQHFFSDESIYKCAGILKKVQEEQSTVLAPNPKNIFIKATHADYGCTDEQKTDEEKSVCRFLKQGFGIQDDEQYLSQVYYGYLTLTSMKITAKFPADKVFRVHEGFQLKADSEDNGIVHTMGFDDSDEEFDGNEIVGVGAMVSQCCGFDMTTVVRIRGNSVYMIIAPKTPRQPVDIAAIPNVRTETVFAKRHLLKLDGDIKIVFQGEILIGQESNIFKIGGENSLVEQHIYGNSVKNRLVACTPKGAATENMRAFIAKLGMNLEGDLFNVNLKDICFTYLNEEDETWHIKSKYITAEKGFWLHANATVNALNKYGRRQDFVVSIKMRSDPDNKTLIFSRPPMYFYKILEAKDSGLFDQLEKNAELDYKVVITKTNTSKDKGPNLIISEVPTQPTETRLKGYITTIAFQGDVDFTVHAPDYDSVTFTRKKLVDITKRQEEEAGLLTNGFQVKGSVALGHDNLQFSFTGSGLVSQIKRNYTLLVAEKIKFVLDKLKEHEDVLIMKVAKERAPFANQGSKKDELEKMYAEIQSKKAKLYEEDKKRYGPCKHCKTVKAPGFVWNSCPISDRLGKVSCLQFKKDALKSCDVQCLARCDISKVDAEESSINIHKDLAKRSQTLKKRSQLTDIYDDLNRRLDDQAKDLADARKALSDNFKTFQTNVQGEMPILELQTDWTDFSNFDKYDKLEFTMIYSTTDPYRNKKKGFVVDGYLPSRMAEMYFRENHGNTFESLENDEKLVQENFGAMLGIISNWKLQNREILQRQERGLPIQKKVKRTYDNIKIHARPSSLFHDDYESTDVLLKKHSPWNILRRSNPFPLALNSTQNKAKRFKVSKSASFCRNRRNRIRDYKDMIKYMTSWSDSFDQAKTFLQNSKTDIMNGINSLDVELLQKRSLKNGTMSKKREDIGKKWINRMKSGFSTWENEFNQQLSSYHSIAPKLMWNEMNAIFTPAEFDSLQSYLRSTPSNALARSIAPDPPIQQIGMSFLNGFASMKTLDDNRKLINQMASMVQQAEQSSQSCHDEL